MEGIYIFDSECGRPTWEEAAEFRNGDARDGFIAWYQAGRYKVQPFAGCTFKHVRRQAVHNGLIYPDDIKVVSSPE